MSLAMDAGTTATSMPNANGSRPPPFSARLRALTRALSRRFGQSTSLPSHPDCICRTWHGSNIFAKALVQPECGWFARKIYVLLCLSLQAPNLAYQIIFLHLTI